MSELPLRIMKKLLLLLTLALAFSASTQHAQNDVRPYLHWKIEYVKIDNDTNEVTKGSLMINKLELEDVVADFRVQCSSCEIRAIYRDYYYQSCTER